MNGSFHLNYVVAAGFFSLFGMLIFAGGFWIWDKVTPYQLWKELIEEQNTALAIVVGSVAIGISLIISSAIHG